MPLKPSICLPPRQNHLPSLAHSFVYLLWGPLQGTHPRVHGMPPFQGAFLWRPNLSTLEHDAIYRNLVRTCENLPSRHSGE